MITEIIRYQIPATETQAFKDSYKKAMALVDQTGFASGWEILQQTEDPSKFQVIIRWNSAEAHLEGFRKSAEFAPFFQWVKPFFQAILEMQHYHSMED